MVRAYYQNMFTSDVARKRFLGAYDVAMDMWPQPRTAIDVETSFGSTYVHRYWPADGVPIVLLHGAGGNSANWFPQVPVLGKAHPVYAIDTVDDPGRSRARRPPAGSEDYARWLDETLVGLDLGPIHLVGFSYGGWLALNQAIYGSARLLSVTAIDPGGLAKVPARFFVHLGLGALVLFTPRRVRPWLARRLALGRLFEHPAQVEVIKAAARGWRSRRPAARRLEDDELRSIRVPLQLLLAEQSTLISGVLAEHRVKTVRPETRIEVVPGAGHGLTLDQPDLVNERVLTFAAAAEAESPSRG